MLRTALSDCGVDTSLLYTVDGSCGTAIILLQPSGKFCGITHIQLMLFLYDYGVDTSLLCTVDGSCGPPPSCSSPQACLHTFKHINY